MGNILLPDRNQEQEAITGMVPIPQFLQCLLQTTNPSPNSFVLVREFHLLYDIKPEKIEKAVSAIAFQHDALRSRFMKDGGEWKQSIVPPEENQSFRLVDLSCYPEEEQNQHLISIIASEVYTLDITSGPLFKCVVVNYAEKKSQSLFVSVSHLIADGISLKIILQDLYTALAQLEQNQNIHLPKKTTSLKTWGEWLASCVASNTYNADVEKLILYKKSWPSTGFLKVLPLDYPLGDMTKKVTDAVNVQLSVSETKSFLEVTQKNAHVSSLDILQTALAFALAKWSGISIIPICVVVHGRDSGSARVNITRTVGFFSLKLLEVITVQENMQPIHTPQANPQLRFAQELLCFSGEYERKFEANVNNNAFYDTYCPNVVLNYIRQLDANKMEKELLWEPVPGYISDSENNSPRVGAQSLDCYAKIFHGQLHLFIQYSPQYFYPATIENVAQQFLIAIQTYIK
ncbi:condensation domain-containing protein [Tengunoibacter tsumagoiensis]|uniref:Condensation domain-containing protein n=1 Tax=Tengunoibacter tsumagoiensis TaxID=2014871 RepID=A0A402A726_9CHLR|nr:condensation domain-containing protein [Tengunoibacter tsumagoiensis]GCE14947.1 hypothetical protein KTT_48060 [Tengunoibacter tsumagoiensis]